MDDMRCKYSGITKTVDGALCVTMMTTLNSFNSIPSNSKFEIKDSISARLKLVNT